MTARAKNCPLLTGGMQGSLWPMKGTPSLKGHLAGKSRSFPKLLLQRKGNLTQDKQLSYLTDFGTAYEQNLHISRIQTQLIGPHQVQHNI